MTESPRFKNGEKISVSIEKLIFSGPGLARTDRGVVFVDFAAPGDELEVEITETKKNYARAKIVSIEKASPLRTEAPCRYFGTCGGCDWQHLQYPVQLKAKHQLLQELFAKELGYNEVQEVRSSPSTFSYRNRIQVHMTSKGPSYRSKRSHELVPIDRCLIAEESINTQLLTLKAKIGERLQISAETPIEMAPSSGGDEESELNFDFSQVNTTQNQALQEQVRSWLKDQDYTQFIDLYSGAGNFTFVMAESLPKAHGIAVESHPISVQKAQSESRRRKWSPKKLSFLNSKVDSVLGRLSSDLKTLIFLDPPRAGVSSEVAHLLSTMSCSQIVYLSCDPVTLVRDLKIILRNENLKLDQVIPFDMFPQTSHCEVLVSVKNAL